MYICICTYMYMYIQMQVVSGNFFVCAECAVPICNTHKQDINECAECKCVSLPPPTTPVCLPFPPYNPPAPLPTLSFFCI